jgi:hypothetical protein
MVAREHAYDAAQYEAPSVNQRANIAEPRAARVLRAQVRFGAKRL